MNRHLVWLIGSPLALVACGGGGSGGSSTPPPPPAACSAGIETPRAFPALSFASNAKLPPRWSATAVGASARSSRKT